MQQHVVFLIHGMGIHPEGWSDSAWSCLKTAYEGLDRSHLWPWEEGFERVEIRYDDCFETVRRRWREDSARVLEELGGAGLQKSAAGKLAETAQELGDDDFVTTHILDVIMYRFLDTVREAVKTSVGRQIADRLAQLPTGVPWSVIAHSLGTAVAHDTLHALAVAGDANNTAVRRAQMLVTLANVSRTLQTDVKAYGSRVRPVRPGQPGILRNYMDIHHKWDPIPAFWPFEPHDEWPDPTARSEGRFQEIALTAFSEPMNVHGLEHYLRDPSSYVPVFRGLTMPGLISREEADSLRMEFLQQHPQSPHDVARRRLEKLFRKKTGNHRDLVLLLRGYLEEMRNA